MKWFSILFLIVFGVNVLAARPGVEVAAPVPEDVRSAEAAGSGNKAVLKLNLTDSGARKFEDYTSHHVGEKLSFIVGGKVINAPVIRVPIRDGKIEVSYFTVDEARDLAKQINQ